MKFKVVYRFRGVERYQIFDSVFAYIKFIDFISTMPSLYSLVKTFSYEIQ